MDGKRANSVFLSIYLLSFILSISISSSFQTQTQTLFITHLSKPQTLTQTQTQTQTIYTNQPNHNLSFELHHVTTHPSLSTLSSKSLLDLLLKHDRLRVSSLSAHAAKKRGHGVNSSVFSGVPYGSGEYFTRIGFGTPSKYMDLILDTGSDIIWIQCSPCKKCYNQFDPLFAPKYSTSSSKVFCGSKKCPADATCNSPKTSNSRTKCQYRVLYGDGSFTSGDYMTEKLSFRGITLKNILFGCGYDNEGLFFGAAGLLGLGRGKLSFPGQVGRRFNNKFSYCLVERFSLGKSSIMFGDTALSRKAVYTNLLTNPDTNLNTYYYVALEGISVGGKTVPIPSGALKMDGTGEGGVIVDSGTIVTRLVQPAYVAMRDAFRNMTANLNRSSEFSLLDTCYNFSGLTRVKVPKVSLLFKGAKMDLPAKNYMIKVDKNGTFCFAFAGTTGGLSIIGNTQQQGFRVSYDLENKRIGFTPKSC